MKPRNCSACGGSLSDGLGVIEVQRKRALPKQATLEFRTCRSCGLFHLFPEFPEQWKP